MKRNWQTYLMYGLTALLTVIMFLAGVAKLMGNEMLAQQFVDFGYPTWFYYLTGVIEAGAAILLWVPRFRLTAALLIIATMLGAAFSNLSVGANQFIPLNLALALIAAIIAWNYRNSWPLTRSSDDQTASAA